MISPHLVFASQPIGENEMEKYISRFTVYIFDQSEKELVYCKIVFLWRLYISMNITHVDIIIIYVLYSHYSVLLGNIQHKWYIRKVPSGMPQLFEEI